MFEQKELSIIYFEGSKMTYEKNPLSVYVGQKIRFYRKKKNISQEELAAMIHKSKSTLSKYESGKISVDIDSLYDIAKALDVEFFQLVDKKVRENKPKTQSAPLFDGKDTLYMYYYDGRFRSIVNTVLEIKYSRARDNQVPCYCYMDCPSMDDTEHCKYFYIGVMTCFDLVSYVTLGNPNNPMEQMTFSILNPFHRGMETWGFMLALSYNPITPLALKFLIMAESLTKEQIKNERLLFSKDELKVMKDLNMMLLKTTWP